MPCNNSQITDVLNATVKSVQSLGTTGLSIVKATWISYNCFSENYTFWVFTNNGSVSVRLTSDWFKRNDKNDTFVLTRPIDFPTLSTDVQYTFGMTAANSMNYSNGTFCPHVSAMPTEWKFDSLVFPSSDTSPSTYANVTVTNMSWKNADVCTDQSYRLEIWANGTVLASIKLQKGDLNITAGVLSPLTNLSFNGPFPITNEYTFTLTAVTAVGDSIAVCFSPLDVFNVNLSELDPVLHPLCSDRFRTQRSQYQHHQHQHHHILEWQLEVDHCLSQHQLRFHPQL